MTIGMYIYFIISTKNRNHLFFAAAYCAIVFRARIKRRKHRVPTIDTNNEED